MSGKGDLAMLIVDEYTPYVSQRDPTLVDLAKDVIASHCPISAQSGPNPLENMLQGMLGSLG